MHALDEIKTKAPYKDRLTFEVVTLNSKENNEAAAKYEWEGHGHGLVVLNPDGSLDQLLAGHMYAKTDESALAGVKDVLDDALEEEPAK